MSGTDRARRIGVFRALQLGDMLCCVPALRSLRAGAPGAQIVLVGLPWARAFVERYSGYIDGFVEFPGHPALPEQPPRPERWRDYLATVRGLQFDLALQMHGSGTVSNALVAAWGARRLAGFGAPPVAAEADSLFIEWDDREHEVLRYVRLMRHLGMPERGVAIDWPATPVDSAEADAVLEPIAGRPFVVVHPGARLASRRWPLERYAAVADALAARGYRIVLTGAADEMPLVAELAARLQQPALDSAGQTSLGGLAALLERATLLVCNDTGISHVAAATRTPSVVISCGSDPERWRPLDRSRHVVLHASVPCRPCMYASCPIGHPCAAGVTVDAVLVQASQQLALVPSGSSCRPAVESASGSRGQSWGP